MLKELQGTAHPPAAGFGNLFFYLFFCGFQFHPTGEAEKFYAAPKAQRAGERKHGLEAGSVVPGEEGAQSEISDFQAAHLPCHHPNCPPVKWKVIITFLLSNPKHLRNQLAAEAMGIADLFRQRGIRKWQSPGHKLGDLQAIIGQQISFR